MARIKLFLDEDVRVLLAEILRQRGYDAIHVLEAERGGQGDQEQLAYAADQGRALLTHNIRDYLVLDQTYRAEEKEHCGIVVSNQVPLRELLCRTLSCLSRFTAEEAYKAIFNNENTNKSPRPLLTGVGMGFYSLAPLGERARVRGIQKRLAFLATLTPTLSRQRERGIIFSRNRLTKLSSYTILNNGEGNRLTGIGYSPL